MRASWDKQRTTTVNNAIAVQSVQNAAIDYSETLYIKMTLFISWFIQVSVVYPLSKMQRMYQI